MAMVWGQRGKIEQATVVLELAVSHETSRPTVRNTARITVGPTPMSDVQCFSGQRDGKRAHKVENSHSQNPPTPSVCQMARTAWILFSYVGCFPSYRPVVNTPVFGSRRPLSHCSLTLTTSVGQPHREAKAPEQQLAASFCPRPSSPPMAPLIGPSGGSNGRRQTTA